MKTLKKLTIHPKLGNDIRDDVIDWCITQWGDYHDYDETNWRWYPKSNYTRSTHGSFDVIFQDIKAAQTFLLRWGGEVVDKEYEEHFAPDPEVLNILFY